MKTTKETKINTLDIQAKEWFDKVNGNSYFSAQATIDFGLPTEQRHYVPFQYGYGDSYQYNTIQQLQTGGFLPNSTVYGPSRYCRENGIVLRASIQTKCLKRNVMAFGSQ